MERDRLKKLARSLEALARKDELRIRQAKEIAQVRRKAALELHSVCREFVEAVNRLAERVTLELTPADYTADSFHDAGANLIQINATGRVVQIAFEAVDPLVSTENFRIPYTLQGAVRWYNQELLEGLGIQEHLLFYCLEKRGNSWRFYDAITHRTGGFNEEFLASTLEQLL